VERRALVSVVIPAYNASTYLGAALQSVASQDYRPLEVILVDDGSTDNTREVVESFRLDGLYYIQIPNSGGPARPRNTGIQSARGKYIFLFDSDDTMLPEKISRSVKALDSVPHVGLLFTDFQCIGEDGNAMEGAFLDNFPYFRALEKQEAGPNLFVIRKGVAYDGLVHENFIGTSSAVVPREIFTVVGGFDEELRNSDDRDMWFRISRRYDIGFLDRVCHRYLVREGSVFRRDARETAPSRIAVFENQLKLEIPWQQKRRLRRWIARNYNAMGHACRAHGDWRGAIHSYVRSLVHQANWSATKGLADASTMGQPRKWFRLLRGQSARTDAG
jgi:glycosyltransferase involved in cell wall biosynthesis